MATYGYSQLAQGSDLVGPSAQPQPYPMSQLAIPQVPNNPSVSNQNPPPNTTIKPTTAISFQVQNATGKYAVGVRYPDGTYEVVWDGVAFSPFYIASSGFIFAPIGSTGFSILRAGGWTLSPTVQIITGF